MANAGAVDPNGTSTEEFLALSDSYAARGLAQQSAQALTQAFQSTDGSTADDVRAMLFGRMGLAMRADGRYTDSHQYFAEGIRIAESINRKDLLAALLNDQGLTYAAERQYREAANAFQSSRANAIAEGHTEFEATATTNLIRSRIDADDADGIEELFDDAIAAIHSVVDRPSALAKLLEIGDLQLRASRKFGFTHEFKESTYATLTAARRLAEELQDDRSGAYALGYIGALYEYDGRIDEALALTRQATFIAQGVRDDESLYRWQWQAARLLIAHGNVQEGFSAYRQAIATLDKIRTQLITRPGTNYAEQVRPLYLEFADVLLSESSSLRDSELIRERLLEVRSTLEKSKVADLVDYFADECAIGAGDFVELDRLASSAAVLYPVLLNDRLELLVSFPSGLRQFSVQVNSERLEDEIRKLRLRLQSFEDTRDYLEPAQNLHQWLIKPLESQLQREEIDTLVVVPDGGLRTIPLSVLHDGNQYLIEKYALGTTLGLSLTSGRPIPRDRVTILASGITESVQGYPALPSVSQELTAISETFPATVYKDGAFLSDRVQDEISQGEYAVVHIATHGVFDSDHSKSFLLAYDDKLTMDALATTIGLRRYQEDALELLVLSACETAAGDDRAALGLAGVAFRAGARSALATLWSISDESTALLVADFYKNLANKSISKAEALRRAQRELIRSDEFSHPAFWAPFLLIGNWL